MKKKGGLANRKEAREISWQFANAEIHMDNIELK